MTSSSPPRREPIAKGFASCFGPRSGKNSAVFDQINRFEVAPDSLWRFGELCGIRRFAGLSEILASSKLAEWDLLSLVNKYDEIL